MKNKLNCILLIDDDEPTNFLSRLIVEEAQCAHHVQVEDSGEGALSFLSKLKDDADSNCQPCPELIFLDINMPAMNGWEFLERYMNLDEQQKANVVVVMLTTSLNPDDNLKAETLPDVSGFENKPLTKEKLEYILQKYFPHHF